MATIPALLRKKVELSDNWFNHFETFTAYKKPLMEHYEIATTDGSIQMASGVVNYYAGDYLIIDSKKSKYPIKADLFKILYDDLNNGCCSSKKIKISVRLADHNGSIITSFGEVNYACNRDYIIKYSSNMYGVVKTQIFDSCYYVS